ncbi:MAG: DNA polymerase III subunit gamma/tau [Candidatus Levybacteria bacterium]|nr:DNA polymerase III subunit gamma/tau [Candidatus Levybacteria bacterium]
MVYYRKYRPQLISELDLLSVREKLTSILSSDEIPHAFLFTGSKGLGKTSSARILAKAINCEKRKKGTVEPCNTCSACITITNGSAVDVLEIDAASNRGIDEIRDLRERIKFSPSSLKTKIYIIDEVHMLTTEAFNALLKTLEEPPSHVMFILATTETHKLPETIMSRVFQLTFEKPTGAELARSLERIVKGEDLEMEDGVLAKIGELSDGAFRDGAKILEELSLQSKNKKITHELLEKVYKTGSVDALVLELVHVTLENKTKESIDTIQKLIENNADFKQVMEKMAHVLHTQLLESVALKKTDKIHSLQQFLKLLDEAYKNLRGAVLPSLPLEIAVIEFCLEVQAAVNTTTTTTHAETVKKDENVKTTVEKSVPHVVHASSDQETFKKLVDLINLENKILAGLLRGSHLEIVNDKATLKPQSSFHMQKLSEEKNKEMIERKLSEVIGGAVVIEFRK